MSRSHLNAHVRHVSTIPTVSIKPDNEIVCATVLDQVLMDSPLLSRAGKTVLRNASKFQPERPVERDALLTYLTDEGAELVFYRLLMRKDFNLDEY